MPKVNEFVQVILQSQDTNKFYQKSLDPNNRAIPWPFNNTYKVISAPDFKTLCKNNQALLTRPTFTQVLGYPTTKILEAEGKEPIRRTKQNFSFYPNDEAGDPSPVTYNYLILDIDGAKIPDEYFKQFEHEYTEQSLSLETIEYTARLFVNTLFSSMGISSTLTSGTEDRSYGGPIGVRLSASFGKSSTPDFRGHILVPLSQHLSVADISRFLHLFDFVDTTIYQNPTQPIFTSAPSCPSDQHHRLDPLSETQQNLPRFIYRKGTDPEDTFDAEVILQAISNLPDKPKHEHQRDITSAYQQIGKRGAFNRYSLKEPGYSIKHWLTSHGYTKSATDGNRYHSPDSSSGQAGCIIYPDGFCWDNHDHSPIRQLFPNRRQLSAYDLFLAEAKSKGRTYLKTFRILVSKITIKERGYQQQLFEDCEGLIPFITIGVTRDQVDTIVQAIVEQAFYGGMASSHRNDLYKRIQVHTKEATEGEISLTKRDLEDLYKKMRKSLSSETDEIHPGNPDTVNISVFKSLQKLHKRPKETLFITESYDGSNKEIFSEPDAIQTHIQYLVEKYSAEDWSYPQLTKLAKGIIDTISHQSDSDPTYKYPAINKALYAFQASTRAFDTQKKIIHDIDLDEVVAYNLPFTEESYLFQSTISFDNTAIGEFLKSSFKDQPETIETLRDYGSYLLAPTQDQHLILALVGKPSSGKSTITRLFTDLLGRDYMVPMDATSFRDDFGRAKINRETKVILVNEMEQGHISKNALNSATNFLKELTGRDGVPVRRMHAHAETIYSDALPIIVSNNLPNISTRGFAERLKPIQFNIGFSRDADSGKFYAKLKSELPFLFHWFMSNPRYQNGKIEFLNTESQTKATKAIRYEMSIPTAFAEDYLVTAEGEHVLKKEFKYWANAKCEQLTGEGFTEQDLNNATFLGVNVVREAHPSTEPAKVRINNKRIEEFKDKHPNKELSSTEWAFKNVAWKDEKAMIKELSDFSPED